MMHRFEGSSGGGAPPSAGSSTFAVSLAGSPYLIAFSTRLARAWLINSRLPRSGALDRLFAAAKRGYLANRFGYTEPASVLDRLLGLPLQLEAAAIRHGFGFPAGLSVLAVFENPAPAA